MASCNGTRQSTSAVGTSSQNLGASTSNEQNRHLGTNTSSRVDKYGLCFDSFSAFGYVTENGAISPLSLSVCGNCSNGRTVTSRCIDCSKDLCHKCSAIHLSHYANHHITNFTDSAAIRSSPWPSTSFSMGSVRNGHRTCSPLPALCDKHGEEAFHFCLTCKVLACKDCSLQHVALHSVIPLGEYIQFIREENEKLLTEAKRGIRLMAERYEWCSKTEFQMEENESEVIEQIVETTRKFKALLEHRERKLISQVKLHTAKKITLSKHQEIMRRNTGELQSMVQQLTHAFSTLKPSDLISAHTEVSVRLRAIKDSTLPILLCEYDPLLFVPPDDVLYSKLQKFGVLRNTLGCACNTVAVGTGKTHAKTNICNTLQVNVYDHLGNHCKEALEKALTVQLLLPDGRMDGISCVRYSNGVYVINYIPTTGGLHYLHIKIRGEHIAESPFAVNVATPRDYKKIGCPELVFGTEGGEDGQLCRPWGVCCDIDRNIIIADRSNNRVQIFLPDGIFYRKFGEQGSEAGQFNCPAGIASDIMRRIVVADKDNHRIQVFTTNGEFLFMFGEKGSRPGQFNYPWDVDVNSEGEIIVSDTRNHRIQLFSADGSFIKKFGYENHNAMWKHFDSPRGVCFGHDGEVIVTDFNNHCIVVLDACLSHPRYVGKEGSGPEELTRPQGICIDQFGHIIVADSRNNRIQIFESNGSQLRYFGSPGKKHGELDRPSGICVSPDGKIVVVDFGNNRVQVF